jgi:small neutral amino acid transporter SnatA (MarC family)
MAGKILALFDETSDAGVSEIDGMHLAAFATEMKVDGLAGHLDVMVAERG